jgi:hypothetical protein
MRVLGCILCLALASATAAESRPAVRDPVSRNIGMTCKWKPRCMKQQRAAMRSALNYLATAHPPSWRLQLCNKNASRGVLRVDWIGFNNCIRNQALRPPVPLNKKRGLKVF